MSEEMFEDSYCHITNVDISFTVIKQMQDYYKEKIPQMTGKAKFVQITNAGLYESHPHSVIINKDAPNYRVK